MSDIRTRTSDPMLSRRQMMHSTVAVAAATWLSSGERAAAAGGPPFQVKSRTVISHQDGLYHGWPTVCLRKNDELLLAYSGGREGHICPFGRVELMKSDDGGKSWMWPRVLMDSAIDDRDAGVIETREGTLLVTTFTSLAYENRLEKAEAAALSDNGGDWSAAKLARWRAAHRRLDHEQRRQQLGTWMLRSTDGGVSWSARYRLPVHSPHGPIQLKDGRLLYAGKQLWRDEPRVGVAESSDDGESWRWLAEIPARDGDDPDRYHELHAVEAGDGRLVAQIRNHNKKNYYEVLQSVSTDGGRSWSKPKTTGVWGRPSHLLRLADGRLLMSYGHRREPLGCQARLSDDHGRTWSEAMILSGDGTSGDLGYPSTVQLGDGPKPKLLTVWYEKMKDSPNAVLRQARWELG